MERLPQAGPRSRSAWWSIACSGLAIGGFDPVGYFTDHKALLGMAVTNCIMPVRCGVFRNVGNRAAFANDPGIYAPVFGGYDPLAVARGVATAGNPQIWLIHKNRLYFFYDTTSRDAFTAQPVFRSGRSVAGLAEAEDASAVRGSSLTGSGRPGTHERAIPPGDKRRDQRAAGRVIGQWPTVRLRDIAAGRRKHGMTRCDVPADHQRQALG